jgi:DNA-binding PadR family transcriptional regulator
MRGFVTEPMLDVLEVLQRGERMHDWAVVEAAKRSGATVHRVLDQLERAGWLDAEWRQAGKIRRRWYLLTPDGLVRAREMLSTFRTGTAGPNDEA